MTDEELAKKYFVEECPHSYADNREQLEEDVVQGFLAGLKAGRPQWHKVIDGDLPKHNHEVLCLMWGGTKEIGYYENEVWHFENFVADYEDVDYWQEIVLPKESE